MKRDKKDYCANHSDQRAIEIQARHPSRAESAEKPFRLLARVGDRSALHHRDIFPESGGQGDQMVLLIL